MPTPDARRRPLSLHPQFVTKAGKKEFVVLPYQEFLVLQEMLEDAEDLMDLRVAKRESEEESSLSLEEARSELDLS